MKKMSTGAVKVYVLALFARYYGFSPKSSAVIINEYCADLSVISVTINGIEYGIECETSVVKGIGFNGFKLDTLKIFKYDVNAYFEEDTEEDTEDTEE